MKLIRELKGLRLSFMTGWVSCYCLHVGIQDYLGKEKYLMTLAATWVDTPFWIWPVLFLFLIALECIGHLLRVKQSRGQL